MHDTEGVAAYQAQLKTMQREHLGRLVSTDAGGAVAGLLISFSFIASVTNALRGPNDLLALAGSVLWVQVSFVGLFILAHDAIHGSLLPNFPRLNRLWGSAALFIYGGFSYTEMAEAHHRHHLAPASSLDPDYHAPDRAKFWQWYFRFLTTYISWPRTLGYQGLCAVSFIFFLGIEPLHFALGWAVPAVLSSVQLFYFGTFLPHREPPGGYSPIRARSNKGPWLWSLLTCFHFGHHEAHHLMPWVPWWRLPSASQILGRHK